MGRNDITTETQSVKKNDWLRIIPGLMISAVSLAILLYLVKPAKLIEAVRQANPGLVILGGMLTILWLVARAFLWRTLLQEKASYNQVFFTLAEGYFLNNFLPFRLGEVARAFLLSRKARLEFWHIFSTIVIERAFDVAIAAGLFLSMLPFVVGAHSAGRSALVIGSIVLVGFAVLFFLARNREKALSLFERLSTRWTLLQKIGSRIIPPFLDGLQVLTDGRRFLKSLAWLFVNWGAALVQYYIVLKAFFPETRLLWAAFGMGSAALGIAVPSAPGAIGVYESAVGWALSLLGLDPARAVAYAITLHFWNYLINGLVGAYALARDGESLSSLYRQARKMRNGR